MSTYKYLDDNGLIYYHSKVKALLNNKVDKVSGKGLSTNDYTTAEKNKLSGIAAGAEVNQYAYGKVTVGSTTSNALAKQDTLEFIGGTGINISSDTSSDHIKINFDCDAEIPTKTSDLTNDSGFVTNTDYPSGTNAGVIKPGNSFSVSSTGVAECGTLTYSTYQASPNKDFIGKGTLENVITGKGLVSNTDYGTSTTGGVVKITGSYGVELDTGYLRGKIMTYESYGNAHNTSLISKATLENVITGKNLETAANKVTSISSSSTDTQYASAKCVYDTIQSAIGSITGLNFEVVQTLPASGTAGTIYLVPNGGTTPNIYDEYVWITNAFEKIGTTAVDLSGYVQKTEMVAITNAEIDTIVA